MPIKWSFLLIIITLGIASYYIFYPKIENFFVFFPNSDFDAIPEDYNLQYKEIEFYSLDGERLHGWFFQGKSTEPTILFCHGNAGNISHRLDNIRLLLKGNFQLFIFDYRGYGKSTGRPSEKGIYQDGLAAYDYLLEKEGIPASKIILFGRSLGVAVAIETALRRKAGSIIVESGFTSVREMAKEMGVFKVISPIIPPNYNNLEKIAMLTIPKLIIHGDNDEIVPFSMGRSLYESANDPKYFYWIKGAGHNDTYLIGGQKYFVRIFSFIREFSE